MLSIKKFFLINLILFISNNCAFARFLDDDVPVGGVRSYSTTDFSRSGNDYYNYSTRTTYTVDGNKVRGNNGSSYTIYDDVIQNDFSGRRYQINGNLIQPVGANRIPNADGSF